LTRRSSLHTGPKAEQSGIFSAEILPMYSAQLLLILPLIIEFPLTEVSNRLMHRLKEFECPLFQMPVEMESLKIGRSSGNHGTVTKSASASSNRNCIKGFKEEIAILAEARRCCALKNLANPIGKGLNMFAVASQIVENSFESCPVLFNSSQHFQCSTYFNVKFHANSRRL
jgi:hypothetical protein